MEYKARREEWGSEYYITEGEFKGYIVETKLVMTAIYPTNKKNKDGTPIFDISYKVISRMEKPLMEVAEK